ncbi:MAG TPA: tetratricopeptide repeat protein, partial [Chroococcidiopsis sp.]
MLPDWVRLRLEAAMQLGQQQQFDQAVAQCQQVLDSYPDHAPAHHLLGLVALQQQRYGEARSHFEQAIAIGPPAADYHNHAGVACFRLGQLDDGIAHYQRAVELQPQAIDGRYNLALGLQQRQRHAEAVPHLEQIVAQEPTLIAAHYQLGNAWQAQHQYGRAIACYRQAIALHRDPSTVETPLNRMIPVRLAAVWYNLGVALQEQRDLAPAQAAYEQALALHPDYGEALNALGTLLEQQDQTTEAIALYQRAQAQLPNYAPLWINLGSLYLRQEQWDQAEQCFRRSLECDPHSLKGINGLLKWSTQTCHWDELDRLTQQLWQIGRDTICTDISIYNTLFLPLSPSQLKILAQNHAQAVAQRVTSLGTASPFTFPNPHSPRQTQPEAVNTPLRLGYVSGDYRNQAVAHLILRLFAQHQRPQFEVYAYSLGIDDGSTYRRKFESDCDIFRDVRGLGAEAIARQIYSDGIDILIDLEGYTEYARTEIYALRPVPLIVSYLGHPGTMGADYIDYVITDRDATPREQASDFTEQCIYLPTSHLITDDRAYQPSAIAPALSRTAYGLPEDAFVFCAFHKTPKLAPHSFAAWMQILERVPQSVLWLRQQGEAVQARLQQVAQQAGIDPQRLIFAPIVPSHGDYLARYRVADLFLDTPHHTAAVTGVEVLG